MEKVAWHLHQPQNRKFDDTIVFVHHWGADQRALKAHVDMVLNWGFQAVTFDQSCHRLPAEILPLLPSPKNLQKLKSLGRKEVLQHFHEQILHLELPSKERAWLAAKGLRFLWKEEIHSILDDLQDPKILYTFSFPSSAALMALAERRENDVKAWVCDGGPFLSLHRCLSNYFKKQAPIPNILLRELVTLLSYSLIGGATYKRDIKRSE
ncbi:MAG: hypothetical protein KDD22_08075, partial [Bdellovibrionales bacterium]|nr:hypothetical protein [Bdellovibrionales bacterium]